MMKKKKLYELATGAVVAALYVVLTAISAMLGLSSGAIQLRLSEALCVMPLFTASGVPALFVGCVIANLFTGCAVWDVVFGGLATLLGAIGTRALRKHKVLRTLPPVLCNTAIVPFVLKSVYGLDGALWFFAVTVFVGEILSCTVLGEILVKLLKKAKIFNNSVR